MLGSPPNSRCARRFLSGLQRRPLLIARQLTGGEPCPQLVLSRDEVVDAPEYLLVVHPPTLTTGQPGHGADPDPGPDIRAGASEPPLGDLVHPAVRVGQAAELDAQQLLAQPP